ncbi:DUF4293 family protein [Pedobacter sp. HMF7647]|uniref:DUF4293 family protein n=1 Tax=Hufsiella arboris TaxID=2695275 RepID=A0A7K1Y8F8_9SPHI|nr:DUF4293 domain-containing protein [Hufsiella arboris]MXV50884.1 DUF4293 family protein [Hufsiella arboris]
MLQRIQTVWLFLASLAIFLLFIFPLIYININGMAMAIKVTGVYHSVANGQALRTESFVLLSVITIAVALLPLIVISFYKNRKTQLSIAYIAILLVLVYSFWLAQTAKGVVGNAELQLQNYGIGMILPSVGILFIILAIKGIRKDEKLVRSADRLR